MRLEYQILIAVAFDLLLGDPQWLPHPVRGIGRQRMNGCCQTNCSPSRRADGNVC